jgi:hypothetical protein
MNVYFAKNGINAPSAEMDSLSTRVIVRLRVLRHFTLKIKFAWPVPLIARHAQMVSAKLAIQTTFWIPYPIGV